MSLDMYREYILQHYRSPRNRGRLEDPDICHEDRNPLCGDEIHVDVRLDDGRVAEMRFEGRGCAISQASASILTGKVKGRTLDEVLALDKDDVVRWLGIPLSPLRLKCALLALKVLQAGIHLYREGGGAPMGPRHAAGPAGDGPAC